MTVSGVSSLGQRIYIFTQNPQQITHITLRYKSGSGMGSVCLAISDYLRLNVMNYPQISVGLDILESDHADLA